MGLILLGLAVLSIGSAVIVNGLYAHGDSSILLFIGGIAINLVGFSVFLHAIKQYYFQEIINELKKLNGEVLQKSTDGFSFGPDKKPASNKNISGSPLPQ